MSEFQILTLAITILALLIAPMLGLLIKLTIKWTRVEVKVAELVDDMKTVINAKEKVHTEMYSQMKEDRAATDKRLRWLEENVWGKSRGGRHSAL